MVNLENQGQKVRSDGKRTIVPGGDAFTGGVLIVCLLAGFAAWVFVALPIVAHQIDVVLKFWGLR